MKKTYIVTGACGHLGSTIIRILENKDCEVRGLILPSEVGEDRKNIRYYKGDVCKPETLEQLFENKNGEELIVIHTAGIIDISKQITPKLYDVNVNGTKNVALACCNKNVSKMVYVSSVHAIREKDKINVMTEVNNFSPDEVEGAYAKTKAEATQIVLDMVKNGLNAVVVHPSGILGPYDMSRNHLVQLVSDYIMGKLPACVMGGYDFVDVRDVAQGCLLAAEKGKIGECYILSNRHYEIKEVLKIVKRVNGGRKIPVLPIWMAKSVVPFISLYAKIKKVRPLYTKYSLSTLVSNDKFSHDKATSELGYKPRDLYQTISDTVQWVKQGMKDRRVKT